MCCCCVSRLSCVLALVVLLAACLFSSGDARRVQRSIDFTQKKSRTFPRKLVKLPHIFRTKLFTAEFHHSHRQSTKQVIAKYAVSRSNAPEDVNLAFNLILALDPSCGANANAPHEWQLTLKNQVRKAAQRGEKQAGLAMKYLRKYMERACDNAFQEADFDHSGTLDAEELQIVALRVYIDLTRKIGDLGFDPPSKGDIEAMFTNEMSQQEFKDIFLPMFLQRCAATFVSNRVAKRAFTAIGAFVISPFLHKNGMHNFFYSKCPRFVGSGLTMLNLQAFSILFDKLKLKSLVGRLLGVKFSISPFSEESIRSAHSLASAISTSRNLALHGVRDLVSLDSSQVSDVHGAIDDTTNFEFCCSWKIQNFPSLREKYRGHSFYTVPIQVLDHSFSLKIFPSGWNDSGKTGDVDSIYVQLVRQPRPGHHTSSIACCFEIVASQKDKHVLRFDALTNGTNEDSDHIFGVFDNPTDEAAVGNYKSSFAKLHSAGYLVDGMLQISAHISFADGSRSVKPPGYQYANKELHNLGSDLGVLLRESLLPDVTISTGSRKFQAHRAILSCRSEVFRRIFEADVGESPSESVTFADVDPDSFALFLDYVYSAHIPDSALQSMDRLSGLLKMADKFSVSPLKRRCLDLMEGSFNPQSVIVALKAAHDIGNTELKERAMKFTMKDAETLAEVIESPEFDSLSHDVTHEILIRHCRKQRSIKGTEFPDGTDWEASSLAQLQRACVERGLPSAGSKNELASRLLEYCKRKKPLGWQLWEAARKRIQK